MKKVNASKENIDTGWAWVVTASSYLGIFIHCIPLFMNGILYVALLERFDEGETKTSLVGALSSGLLCFAGPLGGVVNNKFSCRVSFVAGAVLITIGFAISAFVPNLNWMILTSGVEVGVGYGLLSSGLFCVLGFYFEKWRDTALSLGYLIVGFGMLTSAPFGIHLVSEYGLSGTFLILACIQAQMCVCGMLCRPSCIEKELQLKKKLNRAENNISILNTFLDVSVIKNISYACYLFSVSAWNFALCVAIMHLPNYVSTIGGSNRDIGWLMTSFSISNVIGRLCGSLTITKLRDKSMYIYAGVLGISGVLTSLFILYSISTVGTYIFAVQLGIFTGWPNSMMTSMSVRIVGVEKLSEAYGLVYVFAGIGITAGPVLIGICTRLYGYLYGETGSYVYSFVVAGGVLLLGSFAGACSICFRRTVANDYITTKIDVTEDKNVNKPFV